MTRLMFVFGTRPEAIKMAPLILKAREFPTELESLIVVTAQHREMLDNVLRAFSIAPDVDLNVMAPGQSLFQLTSRLFAEMEGVLKQHDTDVVIVQGDTTTAYVGAVCGHFAGKKVAHVEAGLRTGDKWAPFPEESNRKMTACVTDYHFPPTEQARQNLLREGYDDKSIFVSGNTVIDALQWMAEKTKGLGCPVPELAEVLSNDRRLVLITGHRRESFGAPFLRICQAFRDLALANPDVAFVYPVHLNPNVQGPVREVLSGLDNFYLISPQGYPSFVWFMQRSYLIITDSGGVQEEAPALGKPVLVTRNVTERPEAVDAGVVLLVGDDGQRIVDNAQRLLSDEAFYRSMARGLSPYGDGRAAERILKVLTPLNK